MRKLMTGIGLWLGLLALFPGSASAQWVTTTNAVNVRAGPSSQFPLVSWLPAVSSVRVVGCTSGWQWCDVVVGRTRGWVHARYLAGLARGRTPIVGFSVADYWDAHYRHRPWYASRSDWLGWGSPSFRPPPPPPPRWR
jgi:uncharacterized protein YraI